VQVTEVQRKKKRSTNKSAARSIAGVSMEVINKRRCVFWAKIFPGCLPSAGD